MMARAVAAVPLLMLALAWQATPARAADWRMDAAGSRLEFAATFEKNAAPGVFREFDTRLRFDPRDLAASRLEVTVTVSSADMNSGDINAAIRAAEWFDFARFPRAEFRASDIRRVAPNRYVARGTLLLKGMRQVIEVPFSWADSGPAAPGGAATATMEGELSLRRGAFGIGSGEWATSAVIGPDVRVKFRVSLRRDG